MRPFLAFDTATDHLALALGDLDAPGEVLATEDFAAPRAANTVVLSAAERLLERMGLQPTALGAIAVGRGPGSFTGVRIGVATAKGIASGLRVPLVGFSTIDAVALRTGTSGSVGVVGDAMRGEVYPALFRQCNGRLERTAPDRVAQPALVAQEWAALGESITLTGNGLTKHLPVFAEVLGAVAVVAPERTWAPDGASLLAAAWAASGPGTLRAIADLPTPAAFAVAHPQAILPVYTRLADAEEAERLRLGGPDLLPDAGVAGPGTGGGPR